ncbi:radical SAM family heme chaperone HemW [Halarcobacter mediterraneus]|nr:radical SAM family heme chaperone HemW [Halarcobacter mediterraneus]
MLLYMHIPFCDSKCHYCAFNSYTTKFNLKKEYMKALNKQLQHDLYKYCQNKKLETIFIGGGTPSTINPKYYEETFKILENYIDENTEITTESNPNSATRKWQKEMMNFGVNRISFGVQSFQENKLKELNRAHNANSAITAIQNASCIGFDSINCDIIYGFRTDTINNIKEDLLQAFSLPVTHLSAYSLTLEEGTKFFNKSEVKIDDEALSYEIFDFIEKNGFSQYEISNFAKDKRFQSKHNFGYWEHKEYLGVGAGAVGYINNRRYYPSKDLDEYIKNPISYEIEELSNEDIKVEKVLLGFRCILGVELSIFTQDELKRVEHLIKEEKIYIKDKKVYNKNFLLADEIALYILE